MAVTLAREMARRGSGARFTPVEVREIAGAVLDQLDPLHREGKAHGGVRAATLALEGGAGAPFTVRLAPPGSGGGISAAREDLAGVAVYLAPEVLDGGKPVPPSDLHAVGVLVAAMVTGKVPYAARTFEQLKNEKRSGVPDVAAVTGVELPAEMRQFLRRTLSPDPGERYPSLVEARHDLTVSLTALGGVSSYGVSDDLENELEERRKAAEKLRQDKEEARRAHAESPGTAAVESAAAPPPPSAAGGSASFVEDLQERLRIAWAWLLEDKKRLGIASAVVAAFVVWAGSGGGSKAPRPREADAEGAAERAGAAGEEGGETRVTIARGSGEAPKPVAEAFEPEEDSGKAGIRWIRIAAGETGAFLAKTETTVAQYRACVEAGACKEPVGFDLDPLSRLCNWGRAGSDDHPITCVSWSSASAFCRWAEGDLPTVRQWETALLSRRSDAVFPWGTAEPSCSLAVLRGPAGVGCGTGKTSPVCSLPAGHSPLGHCDLVGNAAEWALDVADFAAGAAGSAGSADAAGLVHAVVGGSLSDDPAALVPALHAAAEASDTSGTRGFRCAR